MFKKLKYAIKTTTKKVEEMQEESLSSKEDEANTTNRDISKKRNFQEIPPQSRLIQNIVPNLEDLESHPPGTIASLAQTPKAGRTKAASKKKTAQGKDYLFLFTMARFGGNGGAYNSNNNTKKGKGNKRNQKGGNGSGGPPRWAAPR